MDQWQAISYGTLKRWARITIRCEELALRLAWISSFNFNSASLLVKRRVDEGLSLSTIFQQKQTILCAVRFWGWLVVLFFISFHILYFWSCSLFLHCLYFFTKTAEVTSTPYQTISPSSSSLQFGFYSIFGCFYFSFSGPLKIAIINSFIQIIHFFFSSKIINECVLSSLHLFGSFFFLNLFGRVVILLLL